MKTIVIVGYLGFGNIGDELMLLSNLKILNSIGNYKVIILRFPYYHLNTKYFQNYSNLKIDIVFYKKNKLKRLLQLFRIFKDSDVIIWSGGTPYNVGDNITPFKLLLIGKLLNKKIIQIGIGLGKLNFFYKNLTKLVLCVSDCISFRDSISLRKAKQLCPRKNFELTGDLVYLFDLDIYVNKIDNYGITISLHNLKLYYNDDDIKNYRNIFYKEIVSFIEKKGIVKIDIISVSPLDDYVNKQLFDYLKNKFNKQKKFITFTPMEKIETLVKIINKNKFFYGERLHSIVLALKSGKHIFPISYSNKVKYLFNEIGVDNYFEIIDYNNLVINEDNFISYDEINKFFSNSFKNISFLRKCINNE